MGREVEDFAEATTWTGDPELAPFAGELIVMPEAVLTVEVEVEELTLMLKTCCWMVPIESHDLRVILRLPEASVSEVSSEAE
jgi:hypothetical protein